MDEGPNHYCIKSTVASRIADPVVVLGHAVPPLASAAAPYTSNAPIFALCSVEQGDE